MLTLTEPQAHARIAHLAATARSRPYLLGIAGEPGAGKSTLVEAVSAPVLPMDGFHFADEHLARLGRLDRKGAPDTFDVAGYVAVLRRLRAGEDVVVPRFDRALEAAIAGAIPLSAQSPIILTEGNYLLHDLDGWGDVRPLLDEVWFIQVDDTERRARLVARHKHFGRSAADAAHWVEHVDEPNAVLIRSARSRADATIIQTLQERS